MVSLPIEDTEIQGVTPDEGASDEGVRSEEQDDVVGRLLDDPRFYDRIKSHVQRETSHLDKGLKELTAFRDTQSNYQKQVIDYLVDLDSQRPLMEYLIDQGVPAEDRQRLMAQAKAQRDTNARLATAEREAAEAKAAVKAATNGDDDPKIAAFDAGWKQWGMHEVLDYAKGKSVVIDVVKAKINDIPLPESTASDPTGVRQYVKAAKAIIDKQYADQEKAKRQGAPVDSTRPSGSGRPQVMEITRAQLREMSPDDYAKNRDHLRIVG